MGNATTRLRLTLSNGTDKDIITTSVNGFDSFDWEHGSPRGFDGLRLIKVNQ
jgi:hypothetical protein